jgi:sec-independent protein translocase protein TatB
MDFLGIGPLEIVLVVLIAFIVLGPDRIPGVMRQLGTWIRQLREAANNITRDYNTEIREITGEINALQEEIRSIQRDLGSIATGFVTPLAPPVGQSHTRSNTAAPADPIPPDPQDESPSSAPPLTADASPANRPSSASVKTGADSGDSYEI